jgi:hypothetical protein
LSPTTLEEGLAYLDDSSSSSDESIPSYISSVPLLVVDKVSAA